MTSRPSDPGAGSARPDPAARERAESEAAEWIARRDAGFTVAGREAFERWLAADPRHAEAWRELCAAWEAFDVPRRDGVAEAMLQELAARQRRRRWNVGWAVTTVAAAAAVIGMIVLRHTISDTVPVVATNAVLIAPKQRALPDRSIVKLGQQATIDVNFLPSARHVQLLQGEAHFAVAKDPDRSFVVTAGGVQMRAVGTEFVVTVGAGKVELLVTEGTVAVDPRVAARADVRGPGTDESTPVLVTAGGLLEVSTAAGSGTGPLSVQTLSREEIERRLEWLAPRLELSGTPLGEAVELFNRDNGAHISIADAALAELRMSGVFRADNVEGFLRLLEVGYGIKVERTEAGDAVLHTAE